MKMCISTIASILLVSLAITTHVQSHYTRINRYLVAHVGSDDVAANLEAANNWLKKRDGGKASCFSTAPISDLKKFTALQQVVDDTKCDGSAYAIMRANDEADNLHKLLDVHTQVARRVDRVMLQIYKEHAEECHATYPLQYRKIKDQLEDEMLMQTVNLVRTLVEKDRSTEKLPEHVFYKPQKLFVKYIQSAVSIRRYAGSNVFRQALILSAGNDPDIIYLSKVPDKASGKMVVRKDKLEDLMQRYFIEPCKHFNDALGAKVFIPAAFDARFYSKVDKTSDKEFYLSWSCYMICKAVIEHHEVVLADITLSAENTHK